MGVICVHMALPDKEVATTCSSTVSIPIAQGTIPDAIDSIAASLNPLSILKLSCIQRLEAFGDTAAETPVKCLEEGAGDCSCSDLAERGLVPSHQIQSHGSMPRERHLCSSHSVCPVVKQSCDKLPSSSQTEHQKHPPAQSQASEAGVSRERDASWDSKAISFLPALLVLPIWVYTMTSGGIWTEVFTDYYPMTIGMCLGSFVAGSTPLGGGVVGFPVAVLVLGFDAPQGRDFAVLIQAVGMNSAAFLILYTKPHMVHPLLVFYSIVFGTVGCILGLLFPVDSYALNLCFVVYLGAFALVYSYKAEWAMDDDGADAGNCPAEATAVVRESEDQPSDTAVGGYRKERWMLALSGVVGGLLTAQLGSGSDCVLYVFGSFVWNNIETGERPISESRLTASTVVVMGAMSAVTAALRMADNSIEREVYLCWLAAAPIVALGAPIGAIVLRPSMETTLRRLFFALVVMQIGVFGAVVIQDDWKAWLLLGAAFSCTMAGIAVHASCTTPTATTPKECPNSVDIESHLRN